LGIVTDPIHYPELIIKKIHETDITFWIGAGKRSIQNMHSGEAVLICDPEIQATHLMLKKCKTANLKFKRILKVNSIEVIANLTANGCGIGLLPSCFIKSVYANKLKRLPNVPVIKNDKYLIYRKEYLNITAIKTIIETIKMWAKDSGSLAQAELY